VPLLILNHARVWNPSHGEGEPAEPRAIWIQGGRIVDVTNVDAAPRESARDDVRVLSFPRSFIMPAFVDAHFHLLSLAYKGLRCDLAPAESAADVAARMDQYAAAHPDDDAVVGVDFDESDWRDAALPTRALLDSISSTRPLYARRVCAHVGVANTALLARLESPARFVDRESGRIVEDAVFEANRLTRPPDAAQIASIDGAIAHLHSLGITAIHDIVDPETLPVYVEGLRRSRRPLRIDAFFHVPASGFAAARDAVAPLFDRGVRARGIKIFADGSLGGRTAALNDGYADGDGNGDLLVEPAPLQTELESCARQGIACAVHAIGDRALRTVLDAIAVARSATTGPTRFRIEHAELIGEEEMRRCQELRIPLVMQPNFVRNWGGEGGMYEDRLGRDRWERHNPFSSLSRAGVPYVFSSDGMPAGPLFGLRGATHHAHDRERIGAAEAFYRYTTATADVFAGWESGSQTVPRIGAGAPADLVVISGHPVLADPDRVRVEATIADGVEVYRAPVEDVRRRR
jgi:predicted amidohydrolase YtcJ